jgi:hypothetical protein
MTSWPPASEQEAKYAQAVVQHVDELAQSYFVAPVENLILKEPGIQRFPLLRGALEPDVAVYIKRHPVAILNSYKKARLYEGWNVRQQFEWCRRDMYRFRPDLVPMLADASDDHETQILSMCCIAHRMADEWAARGKLILVDYEELAFGGPSVCLQLFKRLGLEFPKDKTEELSRLFFPARPRKGFLETQKVSAQRANAYLTELAPWQLSKAWRYLRRIDYIAEVPLQGAHAQVAGSLEYCRREVRATKISAHAVLAHIVRRALGSEENPRASGGSLSIRTGTSNSPDRHASNKHPSLKKGSFSPTSQDT